MHSEIAQFDTGDTADQVLKYYIGLLIKDGWHRDDPLKPVPNQTTYSWVGNTDDGSSFEMTITTTTKAGKTSVNVELKQIPGLG